ncbi:MAG: hypothetical protein MUP70_08285, partial [Candidatus Aminicenantes bacterium]|nr:hypothetical protein [Candidatus Aminicenantes bacterium]
MKNKYCHILLTVSFILLAVIPSFGADRWFADIEGGPAWNGYNDVRIPGTSGTDFSLTKDLDVKTRFAYRFRLGYKLHRRHSLILLLAPLSVNAEGRLAKDIFFVEKNFPAGSDATGLYRFNSWRLTYAYTLVNNNRWDIAIGFTAKIRDAEIKLTSGNLS